MADEPSPGLRRWSAVQPTRTAVVDDDHRRTFAELDRHVDGLAGWLRAHGVGPGGSVLLALRTRAEALEAWLACGRTGATAVLVPAGSTADELAYVAADAAATAAIAEADSAVFPAAIATLRLGDELEAAAEAHGMHDGATDSAPEWPKVRAYTSGTTGRPKAVVHESGFDAGAALAQTRAYLERYGVASPDDVHLASTPFHHISAWGLAPPATLLGQTVVLRRRFDAIDTLATIERERVTWLYLVPTQMSRIAALPASVSARHDLSSVRSLHHGAAPCPVEVKRAMFDLFGPIVWEHYGGTEGGFTACTPEEWLAHPGSVGRAIPGTDLAVLDDDGRPLPVGEIGAVYGRGSHGRFRYDGAPEATAAAWRDDWFTLGDVGYLDDDGFLYLVDRRKDLIVTGGANVYPAEVERVLLEHPAVADVVAIGAPDDDRGEVVRAVVVAGSTTEAELLEHCRRHLVAYKCPAAIDFVDELPRSEIGKLLRRQIRDRYWVSQERSI